MTTLALTILECLGVSAGIWLATEGYWIVGYLVAFSAVVLAYAEGREGWGQSR